MEINSPVELTPVNLSLVMQRTKLTLFAVLLVAAAAFCGQVVLAVDGLAWDATTKQYNPKVGDKSVAVSFSVTNISNAEIIINSIAPSCGCTVVKLPPMPWHLAPGSNGVLEASIDLVDKPVGLNRKTITIGSSAGTDELRIEVIIPEDDRTINMRIAQQDRQAVFKRNECAECHGAPSSGAKKGAELFAAVCANCHESKNRSDRVPDLSQLTILTSRSYWNNAVAKGKSGTLMPAFAIAEGGPLDAAQIDSLADYLSHRYLPRVQIDFGTSFGVPGQFGSPGAVK